MRLLSARIWVIVALVLALLASCTALPIPFIQGRSVYSENCVTCHGVSGYGDGPMATQLAVQPPDLTQLTLNNDGVFPRNRVMSHIDGYLREGTMDSEMPEFGTLLLGNNVLLETGEGVVTPTPRALVAVTRYIESLQVDS